MKLSTNPFDQDETIMPNILDDESKVKYHNHL